MVWILGVVLGVRNMEAYFGREGYFDTYNYLISFLSSWYNVYRRVVENYSMMVGWNRSWP